ncbi:MAG: HTH domain-containing protein [Rhizobiaceae bacterium]|nr:HTH domain-containing protein [Rhizobiaceae bacterium]
MRRADRLLQIIQILRRVNGPIAASTIAEELEVSLRTLYRDMASLESTGVPIRGEAGVGYILEDGYDMPPLMFTASELEALMLGARMLDGRVDQSLSRAAKDAVAKIATVVPKDLREVLIDTPLFAPQIVDKQKLAIDPIAIRHSLRSESQVTISYEDLKGISTTRTIWPVLISFFQGSTVLAAWCTLRDDFRSFRFDRISSYQILDKPVPKRRKTLFVEWKRSRAAQNPHKPERP